MNQQGDKNEGKSGQEPVSSGEQIHASNAETPGQGKVGPSKKRTRWSPRLCIELIFTGTVAFFTVVLAGVSYKQWMVMERQGNIMEKEFLASHRPWVGVEFGIREGLKFGPDGTHVKLTFKTKNHGTSPAVGVNIDPAVYVMSLSHADFISEQSKICARSQSLPPGQSIAGDILFPSEEHITNIDIPIPRSEIERALSDYAVPRKDSPKMTAILPVIMGCVRYRFTFNDSVHRTPFSAALLMRTSTEAQNVGGIDTSLENIPSALLGLERKVFNGFGGSYAD